MKYEARDGKIEVYRFNIGKDHVIEILIIQ